MLHPKRFGDHAGVCGHGWPAIAPSLLQKTLRDVTGRTVNAISVDGDTSTNDTLWFLPTAKRRRLRSKRERRPIAHSLAALEEVCRSLGCKSWPTAKAPTRDRNRSARRQDGSSCETHRGNYCDFSAGENRFRGRRPKLGAHLCGRRALGSEVDTALVDIKMAGIPVLRRGSLWISMSGPPATNFSRSTSVGCGSARGQSQGPLLDLRLHGGVRADQRLGIAPKKRRYPLSPTILYGY